MWTFLLGSRSKPAAWVELQRHTARCQEDYGSMTEPITEVIASIAKYHRWNLRWTGTPAYEIGSQMSSQRRALSPAGSTVARGTYRTAAHRQQLSDCHAWGAASTDHTWMRLPRDRQLTHGQRHGKQAYKNPSHQMIKTKQRNRPKIPKPSSKINSEAGVTEAVESMFHTCR